MIHYHGTPLSPRSVLMQMGGKNFCVPFSDPRDASTCLQIGQSVMFDNGAFNAFNQGGVIDERAFYAWIEQFLGYPHWAVIPDVIGGPVELQRAMVMRWPFPKGLGAPVWHINLPIDYLFELIDTWSRVCIGSAGEFWQVLSEKWEKRFDDIFNKLERRSKFMPNLHALRGLALSGKRWPVASADSVNVARNYKDDNQDPEQMARRIDSRQCPTRWTPRVIQQELFA